MNNTTRYVEVDGARYVLRIYETHREERKALTEHAVLEQLSKQRLPFQVPVPVKTSDGRTVIRVGEGTDDSPPKIASLFHYIQGDNPLFGCKEQLFAFGHAVGRLLFALAEIRLQDSPAYPPYYELERAHPSCPLDRVAEFCSSPPPLFKSQSLELEGIGHKLEDLQAKLSSCRALPHQLIHGDLNASNVLAGQDGGTITAVLDFEFVTNDLRVMELAVCLSDLLVREKSESGDWEMLISALLLGFGSVHGLTKAEIEAIPSLIQLRRLDVFLHFLGRYFDGVDRVDILHDQIKKTWMGIRKMEEYERKLAELCKLCIPLL